MSIWNQVRQLLFPGAAHGEVEIGGDACFWRTDMHSHLLPGVDDGVSEPEQTLAVLKQFADWGIQKIVTTPHVSRDFHPNKLETLQAGRAILQAIADDNQIPVQIDVAAEYLIDDFFPDMVEEGQVLTFGPEKYLLFETGWAASPSQLSTLVFKMQTKGYTPVLAHPERYRYYVEDFATLENLHQNGCLFQLNWGSMVGRYGNRAKAQSRKLLKLGWVDFLGSDIHRPEDLPMLASFFNTDDYERLREMPLRNMTL